MKLGIILFNLGGPETQADVRPFLINLFSDPEIVRIEPEGFPSAGTYRGIEEVQEHVTKGRGSWAEGACDPEKFLVKGDKIVVYLHAWVRLKDSTDWVGGRFADGFVFRKGKITQYLSFGERRDALEWAGIEDQGVL